MSTLRRSGAVALTSVVMCAFLATVPAGAQETEVRVPEAFIASASARGLDISLFGNHITVGSSGALIDSSPKAQAQGAGVLLVAGTVANALVTAANQVQTPPKACVLDLPLGVLNLSVACGEAAASTPNGLPQAVGKGSVAAVDLLATNLLDPILDPLVQSVDTTVGDVLTPLTGILGGLLGPVLGALHLNTDSLVSDLVEAIKQATALVSVRVGPSSSTAVTTAEKVTSQGEAQGAVIDVLPNALGTPLLSIIVGSARATVDVTRPPATQNSPSAAVAVPSFDAAVARVKLLGGADIPVGLGQPLVLLAGTPLESTIALGAGSTSDGANGSKVAVADGVSIHLLQGLDGGIGIDLAHAEAAGGALSAQIAVAQKVTPVPAPVPQLARTGGRTPWMPMLGAGLLAAAYFVRRLTLARR